MYLLEHGHGQWRACGGEALPDVGVGKELIEATGPPPLRPRGQLSPDRHVQQLLGQLRGRAVEPTPARMRQTGVDEDIALDATQGLAHCGQERARATVADGDRGPPVHDLDD